ncbi:hypothetical protein M433DRAFT_157712 [Acidomyces richmondensis BFW]|nr:hypothetical protein M433DRAFT_157712 [Acidomyces richmondensis BFW]
MVTDGGMTVGEKATFLLYARYTTISDIMTLMLYSAPNQHGNAIGGSTEDGTSGCFILDLHLHTINHTLPFYRSDAYTSLPPLNEAVLKTENWNSMLAVFHAVKPVFAEYNKWDEYGIALPVKDFDLGSDERLIDFNGTSIPWRGTMRPALERLVMPNYIRLWHGEPLAYAFKMQCRGNELARDLTFERQALLQLCDLILVRLDSLAARESHGNPEVECLQGRTIVLYPLEISKALIAEKDLVPIMWEFRRSREGASDRYKIVPTRFRLQDSRPAFEQEVNRSFPECSPTEANPVQPPAQASLLTSHLKCPLNKTEIYEPSREAGLVSKFSFEEDQEGRGESSLRRQLSKWALTPLISRTRA